MSALCPNCGIDLERVEAFTLGKLFIDKSAAHVWWDEHPIPLTSAERLIVSALARANGATISRGVLAGEIIDSEAADPSNIIAVYLSRINTKFHAVDPGFDRIENVWGEGVRWRP